ncbi:MAG: hypothetical protein ACYS0I_07555 [Planctomycetota bacterium]|jgi:hypothetical protein
MTVKIAKKQICKKCVIVLICLLICGNSAQGSVLCFGADGHTEIELAFQQRCNEPRVYSQPANQNELCHQVDHEQDKHCEPCVDVPLSFGLAKIAFAPKQLNPTFQLPVINIIAAGDCFNFSAYNSASNTFAATSYFTPLRTVILLV